VVNRTISFSFSFLSLSLKQQRKKRRVFVIVICLLSLEGCGLYIADFMPNAVSFFSTFKKDLTVVHEALDK
jgi:hypothetical protein